LGKQCVLERVLSIRRIRGWVGAEPRRPRVATWGYPEPQLRSSIRMARSKRFLAYPRQPQHSQLSPNPQRCKRKRAFLFGICPRPEPGGSHRETSRRRVEPRMRGQQSSLVFDLKPAESPPCRLRNPGRFSSLPSNRSSATRPFAGRPGAAGYAPCRGCRFPGGPVNHTGGRPSRQPR